MRTKKEIIKQMTAIKKFLQENPDYFDDWEQMHINSCMKIDYTDKFIPDIMRELFGELNLFKENENIYDGYIELLQDNFDINQNIIEVAGGIIPVLGKRLATMQDSGSVTVYDPRLGTTTTNIPNLSLKKEKFSASTKLSKSGLIIAFMPCEATETIIRSACQNNKDFMIAMCEGGPHGDIYDFYEDEEEWLSSMLSYADRLIEDNNMGTLQKTYLKEYKDPYPVIWNKR